MEHLGDPAAFLFFGASELPGEGLQLFGAAFDFGGAFGDALFEFFVGGFEPEPRARLRSVTS